VKYFPGSAATLLGLGVTSKNEEVKQIQVKIFIYWKFAYEIWFLQAEQTCHGSIDKAVGTLLYTIAAKLKAQIVEHRGLLTQYVSERKIASDLQLTGKIWLLYYYYYHHHHQMNLDWLIFSLAVFRLFWITGKVFLQTGCSSCDPTDSVKTLNASVSSIFDHCLRLLGTIFYFFH